MCARISGSSKAPDVGNTADVGLGLDILRARLKAATLEVVWRQWRALGAGAATHRGRVGDHVPQALIDPEALLLVSLALMTEERRLVDLLHDWGKKNSDLLSVQRAKNLATAYPAEVQGQLLTHLSWFATIAHDEGKDLRWRSVIETGRDSDAIPGSRADDATLDRELALHARGGAQAGATAIPPGSDTPQMRKGKVRATRARLGSDAALMLRLRLGFGVGVKADVLAYLLARVHEWATVRDITEAVGYTPAAVRRGAADLAAGRLVESLEGQPASYRIMYEPWRALLGLAARPPRWASWQERFVFTTAFLCWADTAAARPLSQYALGTQGRDFLERYRSALERDLVVVWSAHSNIQDWTAFLGQAIHALAGWMEEMA